MLLTSRMKSSWSLLPAFPALQLPGLWMQHMPFILGSQSWKQSDFEQVLHVQAQVWQMASHKVLYEVA